MNKKILFICILGLLYSLQPIAMHRTIEHGQAEAKEIMQKIIKKKKKLKETELELATLISSLGERTISNKEQIKQEILKKAKKLKELKDKVYGKK